MDEDLDTLSRDELIAEVRRLRAGIREHRDSTGHDLCWHLALDREKLPITKEATMEAFRFGLARRGVITSGWWDRQLGLCLLGALVLFGWEKGYNDDGELLWWCDAAREGARFL